MRNREIGFFLTSHLVVGDARGVVTIVGDVDLEVAEQRGRLALQHAETRDRHPADLELGAFGGAQLEHRAPRARVPGDDDLHLGRVRQRSEEHTSELQSQSISYAVFCLKKKKLT